MLKIFRIVCKKNDAGKTIDIFGKRNHDSKTSANTSREPRGSKEQSNIYGIWWWISHLGGEGASSPPPAKKWDLGGQNAPNIKTLFTPTYFII